MHIAIVVFVAALGLLYFWLLGQWFARVLAFLLLGAVFGLIGVSLGKTNPDAPGFIIATWAVLGIAIAWPLASIPVYVRRHQERSAQAIWQRAMQPHDLQRLIQTERVDRFLR